jgi:Asp-tRNA(Asn)/Glu-tRNA(Gln) amidotransferase B subunit
MNPKLAEVLAYNKELGDLYDYLVRDLQEESDKEFREYIADWIVNTLQKELKYRGLKLKGLK